MVGPEKSSYVLVDYNIKCFPEMVDLQIENIPEACGEELDGIQ